MKKLSLITFFFIFQFSFSQSIEDQIKNIEQKVISWRHDFHKHPELSNREFRTSGVIAKHLEELKKLDRQILIQNRRNKFLSISRDF